MGQPDDAVLSIPDTKDGVSCAGDPDFATVSLTAGEPIEVTATYPQSLGSLDLYLFNWTGGGGTVYSVATGTQGTDSVSFTYMPTTSTTHQIRVGLASGAAVPYHLEVAPFVEAAPVVTGLSAFKGVAGQSLYIYGTGFQTTGAVTFGGDVPASFTVYGSTLISTTVPAGATTGPITVQNMTDTASSDNYFSVKPTLTPPANDNFADRTTLTGASDSVTGTNAGATRESGEPGNPVHDTSVWYEWTAPSNGELTLDTFGSDFDTLLTLYTGSAVNALTQVATDDDDPSGLRAP